MAIWKNFIKPSIEWIGRFQIIQTLIHTEFFRTTFMPVVWTMLTAWGGYSQHVPIMWIMMATSIVFMAVILAMVGIEALKVQKTPLNKLKFEPVFQCDLVPAERPGNRHQRRSATHNPSLMLSASQLDPNVTRSLDKGQLGIQLTNTATFPISFFLQSADTEIAGEQPPRSTFPKSAALLSPGGILRVLDDRIELDGIQCGRLIGKYDFRIKYGLPGKEKFEIHTKATVDIVMEHYGFVSHLMANPVFD